jgi:hypothetical protein
MRQRQAKYRSRCSVRSPCATRKPRRGRPFASLLRRGGETSGVGRRDRRTLCASVARPVWAAHPQFSCSARIACSAKAALRRLGTRSELARQALKSSVAKHGQFLEGPSLRQKRQTVNRQNDTQQKGAFRCSPAPLFETRAALARQELLTKVPVDERQKEHTARNGNGDETQWPSGRRRGTDE